MAVQLVHGLLTRPHDIPHGGYRGGINLGGYTEHRRQGNLQHLHLVLQGALYLKDALSGGLDASDIVQGRHAQQLTHLHPNLLEVQVAGTHAAQHQIILSDGSHRLRDGFGGLEGVLEGLAVIHDQLQLVRPPGENILLDLAGAQGRFAANDQGRQGTAACRQLLAALQRVQIILADLPGRSGKIQLPAGQHLDFLLVGNDLTTHNDLHPTNLPSTFSQTQTAVQEYSNG